MAALDRMGLEEPMLRGWGAWLTAPERSLFVSGTMDGVDGMDKGGQNGQRWTELYHQAARLGEAKLVVTGAPRPDAAPTDEAPGLLWLTPAAFLKQAGWKGMI